MFFLWLAISFFVGILACIPLAKWISPPTTSLLIVLFSPWTVLYMFSQNPTVQEIRDCYLSFIFGMCAYWTYFEAIKKLKER